MRGFRRLRELVVAALLTLALTSSTADAYDLTPLLNLKKPIPHTETGWAEMLNGNADILDNAVIGNGTGINGRLGVWSSASVMGPTSFAISDVALLAAAQAFSNHTFDTSAGNVLKILGTTITGLSGNTGVLATKSGSWTTGASARSGRERERRRRWRRARSWVESAI